MRKKSCDAMSCSVTYLSQFATTIDDDEDKLGWCQSTTAQQEVESGVDWTTYYSVYEILSLSEWGQRWVQRPTLTPRERAEMWMWVRDQSQQRGIDRVDISAECVENYFTRLTRNGTEPAPWVPTLLGSLPEEEKRQYYRETGHDLPEGNEAMRREFARLKKKR